MKLLFRNTVVAFGIIFSVCNAFSQGIQWEKSYGGKQSEYLFDAQPTGDYGFILAGSSLSNKTGNKNENGNGNLDYWIWKMDEKGDLDWQKSFGGQGDDLLQSVKLTNDGGFILAGTSNSQKGLQKKDSCRGKEDFWVIKLDAKGNEEWQRTIGGSGQDQLQCIFPTIDGGFILGGSSSSHKSKENIRTAVNFFGKSDETFGNLDYWVIKLNSSGKIEWQRTLGGIYIDILRSVEQTNDGGFIIGGYSNSPLSGNKTIDNYGDGDYWILKLDKIGQTEWERVYGGVSDDQLYVVHQTFDGNFILAGNSNSAISGNKNKSNLSGSDFWVLKIDLKGEVLWQETYNTGKVDLLTSLVENKDHSLLLGGFAQTEVMGTNRKDQEDINDYIAIKTNQKGEEIWRKSVGSNGEDILRKLIETRDGGYILAGTSKGKVSRDKNSGNGRNDFWVVKLKDKDKKEVQPQNIEAIPNPAQNFTNVIVGYEFQTGTATVYDLSGRQLQQFAISDRTVPVDLSGLPVGIYIVQIKTNESTDSVKVIKGLSK